MCIISFTIPIYDSSVRLFHLELCLLLACFVSLCVDTSATKGQEPNAAQIVRAQQAGQVRAFLPDELRRAKKIRDDTLKTISGDAERGLFLEKKQAVEYHVQRIREKLLLWDYDHPENEDAPPSGGVIEQIRECFNHQIEHANSLASINERNYYAGFAMLSDWLVWERRRDDTELERLNFEIGLKPDSVELHAQLPTVMASEVDRAKNIFQIINANNNRFEADVIMAKLHLLRSKIRKASWYLNRHATSDEKNKTIDRLKKLHECRLSNSVELATVSRNAFYDGKYLLNQWLSAEAEKYDAAIEQAKFGHKWSSSPQEPSIENVCKHLIENGVKINDTITKSVRLWKGEWDFYVQSKIFLLQIQIECLSWKLGQGPDSSAKQGVRDEIEKLLSDAYTESLSHAKRLGEKYQAGTTRLQDWLDAEHQRVERGVIFFMQKNDSL